MYGYTKDLSSIGLASVLPGAPLDELDLLGEHRRLKITLDLKMRRVVLFATAVHYKQVHLPENKVGWLIGARITKISKDDMEGLLSFLNQYDQDMPA